jgi:hypothetical protein
MTSESEDKEQGLLIGGVGIENIFHFTNTENKFQIDTVSMYFENTM